MTYAIKQHLFQVLTVCVCVCVVGDRETEIERISPHGPNRKRKVHIITII